MSESKTTQKAAIRSFTVRGIKKNFTDFNSSDVITPEFHLELDKNNETLVIEDRPVDWVELANKDVKNVGLTYVLDLIKNQGKDIRSVCAFQDAEATDTSLIDPMDPNNYRKSINGQKAAMSELEKTASRMGVTVDSLVAAALSGKVEDLVKIKKEEGGASNE